MIPEFGLFSLILALGFAVLLVAAGCHRFLQPLLRPATYGLCFCVCFAFITLVYAFVQDDFSVRYVAYNSNTQLPVIYKYCALWGGHEGSLLLWVFILSLWTLLVSTVARNINKEILSKVMAVLGGIHVGFLLLLLHTSNPFLRLLPTMPQEGADLNPLLQDPGFVLHPPFLYLGYVGCAVPFAFAIAAMLHPKEGQDFAKWARPFALLAFSFLTIGICLGSWWAYYELGWGGWWFWDPVENASFMPWLVCIALIHALRVSALKPLFASWSILLSLLAFILSLVGTFLVRSGVLSSVHSFASDPARGLFILYFLGIVMVSALGLYIYHLQQSQAPKPLRFISKESFMLLGNMMLVVATATVLLGTLYPLIMEVLSNEKISVGPPYYNAVFVPLMLPLLLLMSIAPYTHWGSDTVKALGGRLKKSVLACGLLFGLIVVLYYQKLPFLSLIGILLGSFVLLSTLLKISKKSSLSMVLAHIGLAVSVLGISLTTALDMHKEVRLAIGETVTVGAYAFDFRDLNESNGSNYIGKQGHFVVSRKGVEIAHLYPEKRFFTAREIMMTETALDPGLLRDFYIALGEQFSDGAWSVRLYVKPFVRWLWLGGLLIAMGASLAAMRALRAFKQFNFQHKEVCYEFKNIT